MCKKRIKKLLNQQICYDTIKYKIWKIFKNKNKLII